MAKKLPGWLARAALFCALAAALLFYLQGMFWNRTGVSMPLYAEPENTIDVLYLGSSKANAAVAPTQMYTAHGFTGYVMYSWSQPMWTGYYYMRSALRRQSPAVVVLEGNDLLYARRDEEYTAGINSVNNENGLLIPMGWDRLCLALAMGRAQTDHPGFFSTLSLGRYHSNWKTLTAEDWLWPLWRPQASTGKGFGPLYLTEPAAALPQPTAEVNGDIYPACLEYLQKCIDYARQEGAAPVLVFYPDMTYTPDDLARVAYLRQLCAAQDVPVLDFTDPDNFAAAGLDCTADMGDPIHLNYRGAAKLTAWLGDWLAATFALPDHRADAAYAAWQTAAEAEQTDALRMQMRLETDFATLLEKTSAPGYITLIGIAGDMAAAPWDGDLAKTDANLRRLNAELAACGLPTLSRDAHAAAALWVWQDGALTACRAYDAALGDLQVHATPGSVLLNGEEGGYQRDGINVMILADDGSWHHAVTWAAQQNFAQYTA